MEMDKAFGQVFVDDAIPVSARGEAGYRQFRDPPVFAHLRDESPDTGAKNFSNGIGKSNAFRLTSHALENLWSGEAPDPRSVR